jgi:hypothetical protein
MCLPHGAVAIGEYELKFKRKERLPWIPIKGKDMGESEARGKGKSSEHEKGNRRRRARPAGRPCGRRNQILSRNKQAAAA